MSGSPSARTRDRRSLRKALVRYESARGELPGITDATVRESFVDQLVGSGHTADSLRALTLNHNDGPSPDLGTDSFNPFTEAVARSGCGEVEDACWIIFLTVAFGESPEHGWPMTSATYRREGELGNWDWDSVSSNTEAFRRWLRNNQHRFEGCKFGNHRKYESLGDQNGFGRTVQTYADWVHRQGTHAAWIEIVRQTTDPFDALYSSMDDVFRFGRLAKFDLLCRLEALDIIDFTPRRAYLQGSTGPLKGTRLLYGHPKGRPLDLDGLLIELESYLNVGFDVLEDALCQWQKQPNGGVSGTCGSPAAPRSCSSAQLSQHC